MRELYGPRSYNNRTDRSALGPGSFVAGATRGVHTTRHRSRKDKRVAENGLPYAVDGGRSLRFRKKNKHFRRVSRKNGRRPIYYFRERRLAGLPDGVFREYSGEHNTRRQRGHSAL